MSCGRSYQKEVSEMAKVQLSWTLAIWSGFKQPLGSIAAQNSEL